MKNTRHNKNDIIFLFKHQKFQDQNFPPHAIALRDLIFREKVELPELCKPQQKKIKLSTCFVMEPKTDDFKIKPRSASTFKPTNDYKNARKNFNNDIEEKNFLNNNNNYQYLKNTNLKENQDKNFCQNCCSGDNKRKNSGFNEVFLCRENSISIVNFNLVEYNRSDKVVNLNNDLGYLLNFKNENKNANNNDNVIVKGRKFSEISNNSSK